MQVHLLTLNIPRDEWNAPADDQVSSSNVQRAIAVAKNVIVLAGTVLHCYLVLVVQHVHHVVTMHVIAGHESSPNATVVSKAPPRLGNKRLAAQGTVALFCVARCWNNWCWWTG